MQISFSKYTGCGNDFILVDNRNALIDTNHAIHAVNLCHRQNAIGADGLILLENSYLSDFKMRIFNSDGTEAEMCGNGIRCLAKFIEYLKLNTKPSFTIETMQRNLTVHLIDNVVSVEMGNPTEVLWNLDVDQWTMHHLDTGVPHAVTFVEDVESLNLDMVGRSVRYHKSFHPRGANANFCAIQDDGQLILRTYERGVEQETLACGTGVTATALAYAKIYNKQGPITVKVRSNELLTVDFSYKDEQFSDVKLLGSAIHVFNGTITI